MVDNDNTGLFSTQPSISVGGDLSFTPAANANGTAIVTVTLNDDGLSSPPNVNSSGPQNFTITFNAINDVPTFAKGVDQTVNENAGAKAVAGWATGINDGDPELTQTLTFDVTNDNNGLFSVQPAVSAAGNLTFTPAANASGSAMVSVSLSDDGSGTPPNVNTTATQTFMITVVPINNAPTFAVGADQVLDEDAGPNRSRTGPRPWMMVIRS